MTGTATTKTKEYIRPMPATWWLRHPAYFRFMLRELSSVFIAGYCIFLIYLLYRVEHEPDANALHTFFFETLQRPLAITLHVIALLFALYHSITSFNAAPKIIVAYRGDEKVPEGLISGVHYLAWLAVSAVLILFALWWR